MFFNVWTRQQELTRVGNYQHGLGLDCNLIVPTLAPCPAEI